MICSAATMIRRRAPRRRSPAFADVSRIIVNRKENAATETAALIIPAVGNNKLRHETLQHFMLANDSVTVAIEVPIWLGETDIAALELSTASSSRREWANTTRAITGHIDFLQVRNGAVHILDYKPDARTNKPIAQLAIYALALTRLVPGSQAIRHQVRVVQRGGVLRVLSADALCSSGDPRLNDGAVVKS